MAKLKWSALWLNFKVLLLATLLLSSPLHWHSKSIPVKTEMPLTLLNHICTYSGNFYWPLWEEGQPFPQKHMNNTRTCVRGTRKFQKLRHKSLSKQNHSIFNQGLAIIVSFLWGWNWEMWATPLGLKYLVRNVSKKLTSKTIHAAQTRICNSLPQLPQSTVGSCPEFPLKTMSAQEKPSDHWKWGQKSYVGPANQPPKPVNKFLQRKSTVNVQQFRRLNWRHENRELMCKVFLSSKREF